MNHPLSLQSTLLIIGKTTNESVTGSVSWERENDQEEHDYEKEGKVVVGSGHYLTKLSSVNGDVSVVLE